MAEPGDGREVWVERLLDENPPKACTYWSMPQGRLLDMRNGILLHRCDPRTA